MKKLSSKPISSPGRTERFPPPLMRFLRSNVGSKSRGKSRKTPLFFRRKSTTTIETQEPSSPKVTCMGQVRVTRSTRQPSNNKNKPSARATTVSNPPSKQHHCKCFQNARFCCLCTCTCKAMSFRPFWRKLRLCSQTREDFESKCGSKSEAFGQENDAQIAEEQDNDDDGSEHESKVFASANSCPQPKNALLLMRSRSAPYRSSSLASQFWASPLDDQQHKSTEQKDRGKQEKDTKISNSDRETMSKDSDVLKEFEGSIKERLVKSANVEKLLTGEDNVSNSIRPLILRRCKSEPARRTTTGKPLDSEMLSWKKKRRLDFAHSSSLHNL